MTPLPSKDAFSMLMSSSGTNTSSSNGTGGNSRRASTGGRNGTQFVPCPTGCGKHVMEKDLNAHLDSCVIIDDNKYNNGEIYPLTRSHTTGSPYASLDSNPRTRTSSTVPAGFSSKKRRATCPACNTSFPTSVINLHLDQCILRRETGNTANSSLSPRKSSKNTTTTTTLGSSRSPDAPSNTISKENAENFTVSTQTANRCNDEFTGSGDAATSCPVDDPSGKPSSQTSVKTGTNQNEHENERSAKPIGAELDQKEAKSEVATTQHEPTISPSLATVSPSPIVDRSSTSVFSKMMMSSKASCARNKAALAAPIPTSTFHLDDHFKITVYLERRNHEMELSRPNWSAVVTIKDKFHETLSPDSAGVTEPVFVFDVNMSTSILPYDSWKAPDGFEHTTPCRWVQRHSRLSVPVLKSILQKAIRRRQPLPAVRVAMEIADKACGALFRRLPIIVLEDSTLHPDLDLLVWIMIAHSKDYVPPPRLMIRIFQIVYEVASCPWSDPIQHMPTDTFDGNPISLKSLFDAWNCRLDSTESSRQELKTQWVILVRAAYGGMRCDIDMLYRYARMWHNRFDISKVVPMAIVAKRFPQQHCIPSGSVSTGTVPWQEAPAFIHKRVKEQGLDRVSSLCMSGIDQLRINDICIQGIDFHCSPILDALLADRHLCAVCLDLLILAADVGQPVPPSNEDRSLLLRDVFQQCMWTHSSAINHRLPFLPDGCAAETGSTEKSLHSEMWRELIASSALRYQRNYVEQRLAF